MTESFEEIANRLGLEKLGDTPLEPETSNSRQPVHVVYGGANLFSVETPAKLGRVALRSIENYAPDFVSFADAMWLKGADTLPKHGDVVQELEFQLADDPLRVKSENYGAWFCWTVFNRVIAKLKTEPVEDFRIDFEDGYGFRTDDEEDHHAKTASDSLAALNREATRPPFCGFRIKSFQTETYRRATRTLEIFLSNLLAQTGGEISENFVVTLPKIKRPSEVLVLRELLDVFETRHSLKHGAIGIELMIETPESVSLLDELANAAGKRLKSAHFGAFDYTASFGITAAHQHLQHDACRFARQLMQIKLAPRGIRLSDSVTTEMPVAVYRGERLSDKEDRENRRVVTNAWRRHFNNVTTSLINGFFQGWDLHPAQLAARYAAVFSFFLEGADEQAVRLKAFIGKATQATLSGNQFDDAASAQGLLNFFIKARNCGALPSEEILAITNLTSEELSSGSFLRILELRKL